MRASQLDSFLLHPLSNDLRPCTSFGDPPDPSLSLEVVSTCAAIVYPRRESKRMSTKAGWRSAGAAASHLSLRPGSQAAAHTHADKRSDALRCGKYTKLEHMGKCDRQISRPLRAADTVCSHRDRQMLRRDDCCSLQHRRVTAKAPSKVERGRCVMYAQSAAAYIGVYYGDATGGSVRRAVGGASREQQVSP